MYSVENSEVHTSAGSLETYCLKCKVEIEVSGLEEFSLQNCPSCSDPIVIPRVFGNYHIIEHLADGPFYSTYKGYKITDKYRLVTLKVFNNYAGINQNNLVTFGELLNQFCPEEIPGTISNYGLKIINGNAALIRPWIAKTALQFLHETNFSRQAACRLMYEILMSLASMESLRVFPVELKLSNILIDEKNQVFISDIGLSQALFTMGGNRQDYLASYFDINLLHNVCLTEVRNHTNITAFACANLFYSLCSGGTKLYNASNVQELFYQRQEYQISIPFRLEGSIPNHLSQEIISLFTFEGHGITLKDKASVFKRFINENTAPKKRIASRTQVDKSKLKSTKKQKNSLLMPTLVLLATSATVAALFVVLTQSPEDESPKAQNSVSVQPISPSEEVAVSKKEVPVKKEEKTAPPVSEEPALTKVPDSEILTVLPRMEKSAETLTRKSIRKWQLLSGPEKASFSKLSGGVLSLTKEDGKVIKVQHESLNNIDAAFLESIQIRNWSTKDNSFLKAAFHNTDNSRVYLLDHQNTEFNMQIEDLAESDQMFVEIVKFRNWTDNENNTLYASLIKVSGSRIYLKTQDLEVFALNKSSLNESSKALLEDIDNKLSFIENITKAREAFILKDYSISRGLYHKALAYEDSQEIFSMIEKIKTDERNNFVE